MVVKLILCVLTLDGVMKLCNVLNKQLKITKEDGIKSYKKFLFKHYLNIIVCLK